MDAAILPRYSISALGRVPPMINRSTHMESERAVTLVTYILREIGVAESKK